MLIEIEIVLLLTLVIYGGNFLLFRMLKKKDHIQGLEKLAIFFGMNMLILLFVGGTLVITLLAQSNRQ